MGKIRTSGLTPMQLSALKEGYRTGFSHFLSFSAVAKNREKSSQTFTQKIALLEAAKFGCLEKLLYLCIRKSKKDKPKNKRNETIKQTFRAKERDA